MSFLKPSANLGRLLRQDDWENLGRPTQEQVCEAIDEGRLEDAKRLARYMVPENKALHDFFCDLISNILSKVAKRHGEEEMADILKRSQETWMMKRKWKGFLSLSVEERVQITAEIMRSLRCGPKQDGTIQVAEDEDRCSILMDSCGSGGRMRRGDPLDQKPCLRVRNILILFKEPHNLLHVFSPFLKIEGKEACCTENWEKPVSKSPF